MNAKQSIMMAMGVVVAVSSPLQAQEAKNATHTVQKKPAAVVRITDSPKTAGKAPAAATLRISDFGQWKVQPISGSAPKSTAARIRISDENVARDVPRFRRKSTDWEPIDDVAPPVPGAPHVNVVPEAPEASKVPGPPSDKISEAAPAEPVRPAQSPVEETPVDGIQPIENAPSEETPVIGSSATQLEPVEPTPFPAFEPQAETVAEQEIDMFLDEAFEAAEKQLEMDEATENALPLIIAAQPDDPSVDGKKVKAAQDVDPAELFGAITEVQVQTMKSDAKVPADLAGEMIGQYEPIYVMNEGWTEYTDRSIYWISHRPLYFEDPNLERCGLDRNGILEPFVSAALFYTNAALLPMHMGVESPCCMVRSKGDCPSCHKYGEDCYLVSRDLRKLLRTKEGWRGVAYQTLAVTGLVFLIP